MDLSGIEILDLTRLLPGPYGTQLLADLGADVIKIEDPERGDYARELPPFTADGVGTVFDAVNRGKRSVAVDLKSPDGQALFYELVAEADVVFEGFRPGVADRLGIDYETLSAHNAHIIYCSLTGFGQSGPLADTAGHDLTYQGYAGLLDLTREGPDGRPQITGYPIADMAGGVVAALTILGGLLDRELGGGGEYIDVSMAEVVAAFGQPLVHQATGSDSPTPGNTQFTGGLPWYDVYETADGEHVTLAALEPKFWTAFVEAIDREDLASVHGTTDEAESEALRGELRAIFAERSRAEWLEVVDGVDAAVGPVLSLDETLSHPHFVQRGLLAGGGGDRAPRIGFPAILGGSRPASEGAPPARGAHTRAVLTEAGIEADRVAALAEAGVVEIVEDG